MKNIKSLMYIVFIAIFVLCLLLLTSLEFQSIYIDVLKDIVLMLILIIDSLVIWYIY